MRPASLLLVLLCSGLALAADAPRVEVSADHGDVDLKAGRARYWGNVSIVHGTTRITADEVEVVLEDGELRTATIRGTPARFQQQPAGGVSPTVGSARIMSFATADGIVELRESARVMQDGDEVAGELIRYDVRNERIVAAGGDGQSGGRVQMTLTPRRPKEEAPPPAATEPPP